ncbi:DUF5995 family protein [Mycolicibacterium arseniciresistens]|uniref:DUF5995 family protein n=1 Tax=Mycolicibacterium arseniciresistens TaxID=3062257 RepID=A0ABT8UKB6_9MYCO|nr:DUF5995 family protein [Mycolicibacterium arseniciresistens]MDO3638243.1 DUF5995 family protein [Mycolicibacterium arseniciresistens]
MTPAVPAPIEGVRTIQDVVDAIDSVILWSTGAESRLGYFAALYKRITIAVQTALAGGAFEDPDRMELFDVAFAQRYFDALNGRFHPGSHRQPTRSWQLTFDAAQREDPIIVAHMFGGVNAHIGLDLGIVVQQITGGQVADLGADYQTINAVLASQVAGTIERLNELSPALADVYAVLRDHEVFVVNEVIRGYRDSAWRFATRLALQPNILRPISIRLRDRKVAGQGTAIYDPPSLTGVLASAVRAVAARESRDVAHNIEVLDRIASSAMPIATVL